MSADNDSDRVNCQHFLASTATVGWLVPIGAVMGAEPAKPSVHFNPPAGNEILLPVR